jgi:hypothetical protein
LIPSTSLCEPNTIRLISTAYIQEPAIAPLCDDEEEKTILDELEGLTSSRLSHFALPAGINANELLGESYGYGWTYVNAAFCHTRASGNRFNGAERGAWYCAFGSDAALTALAEITHHLNLELDNVGVYENVTKYRELLAGIIGDFHDVRGATGASYLHPDSAVAYPAGQALAASILADGGKGIIYPSVRRPGGDCFVALRPSIIQNIRQGKTYRLTWMGSREPQVDVLAA